MGGLNGAIARLCAHVAAEGEREAGKESARARENDRRRDRERWSDGTAARVTGEGLRRPRERERYREREGERESACASERERWREGAWLRKVVYSWGSGDAHHHPRQFLNILGRRDGIVNRAGERRTW